MITCAPRFTTIAAITMVLALALTVPAAVAETRPRVPVVGVLAAGHPGTTVDDRAREAFERGLKETGWVPGQTIRLEYRYGAGRRDRLAEHARELARADVDVIVARATPSIRAAKSATTTIPIVMSASGQDPLELGLVAGFARPGGNVTGLTLLNIPMAGKQLEILKEVVPQLARVAVLGSAGAAISPRAREYLESVARKLSIQLTDVKVESAADIDQAFEEIARGRHGGLVVLADPFVLEANVRRVVALVDKLRLPAIYWHPVYPEAGGLMSYGADLFDILRRAALYVDRILKGARPGDLPVEEPSQFALILNAKTARAQGLVIPPTVQARATEVIE